MYYLGMLGVNLTQVALFMQWRRAMRWYDVVSLVQRTERLYTNTPERYRGPALFNFNADEK